MERTIAILANELDWIDQEIEKIRNSYLPEDRMDFSPGCSPESAARLRFLLSRNLIVRQRIADIRERFKNDRAFQEQCER